MSRKRFRYPDLGAAHWSSMQNNGTQQDEFISRVRRPGITVPDLLRALLLASLLSTAAASAQTLTVSGSCPGPATVDISGAVPDGRVALLTGERQGADLVPGGSCAGIGLDVTGDLSLRAVLTADDTGHVSRTVTIPQSFCGSWLQALSLADCSPSNAALINFAEPTSIDVNCLPTSNPLRFRCAVTVDPPQPVEVRYSRTDGLGVERANRSYLTVGDHQVPVLFLAPRKEYAIEATALGHPQGLASTDTLTTGSPPFDVASWFTSQGAATMGLIGGELPCGNDAVAVVYDTDTGDLVWYDDVDPDGSFGTLNMVGFTDEQTVIGETGDSVVEVDLLGNVITQFDVNYPGGYNLHHDIVKANGVYYSFYQDKRARLTLDAVVVLDPQGNEIYEWNPYDHLPIPTDRRGDWLHTNAVWVEEDGTALLSWFRRDSVAKIDLNPTSPTFGELLWIMGGNPPGELPNDFTIDWSGVAGPDFFSRQHNFHRRHDGRYMLLDNANGRAIVFTLDEENRTAVADAVYPTAQGVCAAQGTAADTEAGNAVVACIDEFVREYDGITDELIWQGEVHCANGGDALLGSARWYPLDDWSKAFRPGP